jgi:hypothetical protein
MIDLVKHLRESATDLCCPTGCCYGNTMVEAADEIERLRAALAPFSDIAQFVTETQRDSRPIIFGMDSVIAQRLTIGHLRSARTALASAEREGK